MTTTNFSDVLAGQRPNLMDTAMDRDEITTDRQLAGQGSEGRDKLDELEQLALEALDDI